MLYSKSLFLVYFMCSGLYLLILYSSISAHSLSLLVTITFVYYVSESVSILYVPSFVLFFRFHMQMISCILSFSDLLHLVSMISSRSTYVAANRNISFSLRSEYIQLRGFPGGSAVKNLPVQEVQETWVQSPGREDPLEEGMTTHSSILAWRLPWTEGPGRL